MATATALKHQIEAIQARIDAVASTATPEDVVMLAKAVEAVGGQATVFDVMEAGEEQQAALAATAEVQKSQLSTLTHEGIAAFNAVADERYAQLSQRIEVMGGFTPPTPDGAGKEGLVPAPAAGSARNVLTADGWEKPCAPVGMLACLPEAWADEGWIRLTSSAQTALVADYPLLAALQGRKRNKLNSLGGASAVPAAGTLTSESPICFNRETREFAVLRSTGIWASTDGLATFFRATTESPVSGEHHFAIAHGVVLFRKTVDSSRDDFVLRADGASAPLDAESSFAKNGAQTHICAAGDFLYAAVSSDDGHTLWRVDAKTRAVSRVNLPFTSVSALSILADAQGVCVANAQGVVCVRHDAATAGPLLAGSFPRVGSANGSGWDALQHDHVQYLNGRFVAVDKDGKSISVSEDLRSWESVAISGYGDFQSLFFHEGTYYLTCAKAVFAGASPDALTLYATPVAVKNTASTFRGMFCLRGAFIAVADSTLYYGAPGSDTWKPLEYGDAANRKGRISLSSPSSDLFYACEEEGVALYGGYLLDADCPYERNNNSYPGPSVAPGGKPEHVFFLDGAMYYVKTTNLYRCPYYSYNPDSEFLLPSTSASGYSVNTIYNNTASCPIFMRCK